MRILAQTKNDEYKSPCKCGNCKPHTMIGMSWWKKLGFNSPLEGCAEYLAEKGFRHISEWACMWCLGLTGTFTHYDTCEQCDLEAVAARKAEIEEAYA